MRRAILEYARKRGEKQWSKNEQARHIHLEMLLGSKDLISYSFPGPLYSLQVEYLIDKRGKDAYVMGACYFHLQCAELHTCAQDAHICHSQDNVTQKL